MKITRQTVADKIADYLHGKVSQAELVDWAERAMMDADFDEADAELLSDILGRLGLADVAEFGLRWQDCEEFIRRLAIARPLQYRNREEGLPCGTKVRPGSLGLLAVASGVRMPSEFKFLLSRASLRFGNRELSRFAP